MDFVDFCSRVLGRLVHVEQTLPYGRDMGVEWPDLFRELFENAKEQDMVDTSPRVQGLMQVHRQMSAMGLIDSHKTLVRFWNVPRAKRLQIHDLRPVWRDICARQLEENEEQLLRLVNSLSEHREVDHAWLGDVTYDAIIEQWESTGARLEADQLEHMLQDLEALDMVRRGRGLGNHSVQSTYAGLVWTTRRGMTEESDYIDVLVEEGETPTVDFKRELVLDTKSQKAEFVKDILALANTKASGRRWLIVGFEPKELTYYLPDDTAAREHHQQNLRRNTQDQLQQILVVYSLPVVAVRWSIVDYRLGPVGKLEVLRDQRELPYSVAKSLGSKEISGTRIENGQVYIRYGAITKLATDEEIAVLRDDAIRARKRHSDEA
jgi:hypothetical protein